MRYPIMSTSDATTYLYTKRAGTPADVESLVKARGEGPGLGLEFVMPLLAELRALQAQFPDGLKSKGADNRFEAEASRIVHHRMTLPAEVAADPDFWLWLAVAHLGEVIEWRYGNPAAGTTLANYGIGSRSENLIFRLWLRADLLYDEAADDPYHLSRRGQIDFYRSHLFRQGYANARQFARALLKFQYRGEDPAAPYLKVNDIRELVKRLRRMRANLFMEILDEEECRRVIEGELARVQAAA